MSEIPAKTPKIDDSDQENSSENIEILEGFHK